jgi:anti-anti-sigma regulatory factor
VGVDSITVAVSRHAPHALPVRPGEHACCHFPDKDDRERLAAAFVRDGLQRGHRVICFLDGDRTSFDSRLEQLDPSLGPARSRGQLEVLSSRDAYITDGRFEPDRMVSMIRHETDRAQQDGYRGLSMTGEVPEGICSLPGGDQLGAYEAQLSTDVDTSFCSLLCQYDHSRFEATLLQAVRDAHAVDAPPELAAIGRSGEVAAAVDRGSGALRLAGELDFACADTVADVLRKHFDGSLRLDLADLTYVDVAGMRALRGSDGQPLVIGPVSHAVRRLLPLLGWDTDPDVELLEENVAHAS